METIINLWNQFNDWYVNLWLDTVGVTGIGAMQAASCVIFGIMVTLGVQLIGEKLFKVEDR